MRPWAYVAILVLLTSALGGIYAAGHSSGYDKRDAEIEDHNKQVRDAEIKQGIQDWIDTQEQAEAVIVYQDRIVTEIEYVDREIPKVVEKIVVERPECRDLGDDYASLLNGQIRAANGGPLQTSDPATGVDPAVSDP